MKKDALAMIQKSIEKEQQQNIREEEEALKKSDECAVKCEQVISLARQDIAKGVFDDIGKTLWEKSTCDYILATYNLLVPQRQKPKKRPGRKGEQANILRPYLKIRAQLPPLLPHPL